MTFLLGLLEERYPLFLPGLEAGGERLKLLQPPYPLTEDLSEDRADVEGNEMKVP